MKKILFMLLAVCIVMGMVCTTAFANNADDAAAKVGNDVYAAQDGDAVEEVTGLAGDGTEASPFLINNLAELIWFQQKVDEQAQDGSSQFKGKYVKLTTDIDLDGIDWEPIGSYSGDHGSFQGVFDGGGNTISNLSVNKAENGLGFFAYLTNNAEIRNLTFHNVSVKSPNNSYVGGVVGNAFVAKITDVHVTGTVDIEGYGYVGGIVGHGYVVVDRCSVEASGTIKGNFWCVGGIVGYGGEGTTKVTNTTVDGQSDGLTITSAAGAVAGIVGRAEDNKGKQPCSGTDLSVSNVGISTFTGAYGDYYADNGLGYFFGGGCDTSKLTGDLAVEKVEVETSTGETPTISDIVASVDGNLYASLQAAIDAAESGSEIELLSDVEISTAIDATKSITINGGKNKYSVTAVGALNGNSGRVFNINQSEGLNVTFKNMKIVGPTKGTYTRGISTYEAKNLVLTLDNVEVSANYYALNIASYCDNIKVNVNDSVLTGWCALQTHSPNSDITVTNSVLTGINDKGYDAEGWNGFQVIVVNSLAEKSQVTVSDSTIIAKTVSNADGNANNQDILSIRDTWDDDDTLISCSESTVALNNCTLKTVKVDGETETEIPSTVKIHQGNTVIVDGTVICVGEDELRVDVDTFISSGVAKIGDIQYTTLQAALDAAEDGAIVTLLKDTDEEITLPLKSLTLTSDYENTGVRPVLSGKIDFAGGAMPEGTQVIIENLAFENTRIYLMAWTKTTNLNNMGSLTIRNNTFTGAFTETGSIYAIHINNGDDAVKNLTIAGNIFTDCFGAVNATACGELLVKENEFRNSAFNALTLMGKDDKGHATTSAVITNNVFDQWAAKPENRTDGRAMRLSGFAHDIDLRKNIFVSDNLPEEYIKLTGLADGKKADANECYWGGEAPAADKLLGVSTVDNWYTTPEMNNEITLSSTTRQILVGKTFTLTVNSNDLKGKIVWSSSNSGVATVDENGVVTAVTDGTAIISATMGETTVTCTVTVRQYTSGGTSTPIIPDPVKPVFTDVPEGAYYAEAVAWAAEKKIAVGTSATTFSPNASCTRAQVVTFLWRAAGCPKATANISFTDVAVGSYYYDAVQWAVEKGITVGTSATTFSPNASCTRAQVVTFLYRYEKSPAVSGSNVFTDVAADAYYFNAVQWAVNKGVTVGTSSTTFNPNTTCTRGQIVTFLYRDMA